MFVCRDVPLLALLPSPPNVSIACSMESDQKLAGPEKNTAYFAHWLYLFSSLLLTLHIAQAKYLHRHDT